MLSCQCRAGPQLAYCETVVDDLAGLGDPGRRSRSNSTRSNSRTASPGPSRSEIRAGSIIRKHCKVSGSQAAMLVAETVFMRCPVTRPRPKHAITGPTQQLPHTLQCSPIRRHKHPNGGQKATILMRRHHAVGGLHLRVELADGVRLQVSASWTALDPADPDSIHQCGRLSAAGSFGGGSATSGTLFARAPSAFMRPASRGHPRTSMNENSSLTRQDRGDPRNRRLFPRPLAEL